MLFPSLEFLLFGLALLVLLALFDSTRRRKLLLLVASYVFYMAWNPAFIVLIMFSTVVDFTVGRRLGTVESPRGRRLLLATSIVANLGLLAVF